MTIKTIKYNTKKQKIWKKIEILNWNKSFEKWLQNAAKCQNTYRYQTQVCSTLCNVCYFFILQGVRSVIMPTQVCAWSMAHSIQLLIDLWCPKLVLAFLSSYTSTTSREVSTPNGAFPNVLSLGPWRDRWCHRANCRTLSFSLRYEMFYLNH